MTAPESVSEKARWNRTTAIGRIYDQVAELIEPRNVSEDYSFEMWAGERLLGQKPRRHTLTLPSLLQCLAEAVEPGADIGQALGGRAFESRPAARLDPIKVLRDIDKQSRKWCLFLEINRETLVGHLSALKGAASQLDDHDLRLLDQDVLSWHRKAKVATGEDPAPINLNHPCPECGQRGLVLSGDLQWAVCRYCQRPWPHELIGLLGEMLRVNAEQETVAMVKCPDAGCMHRGVHGYHEDGKGRYWPLDDTP
jgi:hypothetical protein